MAINCGINGRSCVSSLTLEALIKEEIGWSLKIELCIATKQGNLLRDVPCVFACVKERKAENI